MGETINNAYTATVNWQGRTPYQGTFSLNGISSVEPASGTSVAHTYDLSQDFRFGLPVELNNHAVTVKATNGLTSPVMTLNQYGINIPVWLPLPKMKLTTPVFCGSPMKVAGEIAFPDPAFEGKVNMPAWIPIFGGAKFGVAETQAGVNFEMDGTGTTKAGVSGQTGFEAAGSTITGKVTGSGEGMIDPVTGTRLDKASLNLEIAGEIKRQSVVEIICKIFTAGACPLKEWEAVPVIGGAVKYFNSIANIEGKVALALDLGLNFKSQAGGLVFR